MRAEVVNVIVIRAAIDGITYIAVNCIIAVAAINFIRARVAVEDIIAAVAEDIIVARAAINRIVLIVAAQIVGAVVAVNDISKSFANYRILRFDSFSGVTPISSRCFISFNADVVLKFIVSRRAKDCADDLARVVVHAISPRR